MNKGNKKMESGIIIIKSPSQAECQTISLNPRNIKYKFSTKWWKYFWI